MPGAHAVVHCFWLPAHQCLSAAETFFLLSSPFYPNAQLVVTLPSQFTAITTAARAFDPCHLPETSHFSISLSPVLQLCVANLMLVHVLVSQWTCAVVTRTRIDTPEISFKWSVEQVLGVWLHVWYKLIYNHLTDLPLAVCSCLFHPDNRSQWLCSEFADAIKIQWFFSCACSLNQINKWCQCLVCLHNYQVQQEAIIINSTGPWGIVPFGTRSCSTPMLRLLLSDFAAASANTLSLSWHKYRLFKKVVGVSSKKGSERIQLDLRHKNPKLCWKNTVWLTWPLTSHPLLCSLFCVLWGHVQF